MTRYEAKETLCNIINSGIIYDELEDELNEIIDCICENSFDKCQNECLLYCKLDECDNALN